MFLKINKGFFISKSGIVWTKVKDLQQLENLKTDDNI